MTAPRRVALLGALLMPLVIVAACGGGTADSTREPPTSVEGLEGGRVSLVDPDATTVVAFVASWCAPCRTELPELQARFAAAAPGVRYIAVAVQEEPVATRRLVDETGITFDIGVDPDGVALADYEFIGLPGTLLLSPDGTVAHRYDGTIDFDDLDRRLGALDPG